MQAIKEAYGSYQNPIVEVLSRAAKRRSTADLYVPKTKADQIANDMVQRLIQKDIRKKMGKWTRTVDKAKEKARNGKGGSPNKRSTASGYSLNDAQTLNQRKEGHVNMVRSGAEWVRRGDSGTLHRQQSNATKSFGVSDRLNGEKAGAVRKHGTGARAGER